MRKFLPFSLVASIFLCCSLVHAAVVYKWTDDDGIIQYTDQAPKDREFSVIKASGKVPPSAQQAIERLEQQRATQSTERAQAKERGQDYAEQQKIRDDNAKIREENCNSAQTNLKTLQENARVRIPVEDGEFRYLSEEERQAELDRAQELINSNCVS